MTGITAHVRPNTPPAQVGAGISGSGLGLSIVRADVERAGGTIEVHSEIDKGSAFTLTLPLAEER